MQSYNPFSQFISDRKWSWGKGEAWLKRHCKDALMHTTVDLFSYGITFVVVAVGEMTNIGGGVVRERETKTIRETLRFFFRNFL